MNTVSNEMILQAIIELAEHLTEHRDETRVKFEQIDQRFDEVDKRFEQIDLRFNEVNKRFELMDRQFNSMKTSLEELATGQQLFITKVWNNKKNLQQLKSLLGL